MMFERTAIDGVVIVSPTFFDDARGFFARTFSNELFAAEGLVSSFPQSSISYNIRAATLRGLHIQIGEDSEDKLVRCTAGAMYDVAVDLRPESPTRFSWFGVELTAKDYRSLYIPRGCAHGFVTLEPATEVLYLISTPYRPESARGLRYDDVTLGIEWPDVGQLTMSERDRSWPPLLDAPWLETT